jgi:NAD(P)H-hydrate epimerase
MRRLLGVDEATDLSDRVKLARKFSQKHHVILVLKGERSLIAAPDGKVVVNPTGNPGIGKAGNGDTLAGIITGFIAQSFAAPKDLSFYTPYSKPLQINAAFDAVVAALYIAGMAGDIAAKKVGMRSMTASDVRTYLGEAFRQLENE